MRYLWALLIILGAVVSVSDADGRTHGKHRRRAMHKPPAPASFFLASDPHVPLAVVVDGRVRDAVPGTSRGQRCGDRRRWAKLGSKWNALDAWGQVVETVAVAELDPYDVTGCTELYFPPTPVRERRIGKHVLVSVDSTWKAPASAEWKPAASDAQVFDAIVKKMIPDRAVPSEHLPKECTSITEQRRFFDVPGKGHFALGTSNVGYVIARVDHSARTGWSVVASERTGDKGPFSSLCYRPIAIFDMNGDGLPEVILRWSEGPAWSDIILGLGEKGRFELIASSPGGSTA